MFASKRWFSDGERRMSDLRISLLHLALEPGAPGRNCSLVERGIRTAAGLNADWVVTPELCISGYQFKDRIGTRWIESYPDRWIRYFSELAESLQLVIFFGHVQRDSSGKLYNCVFMIDEKGSIIGHHRKINIVAEKRWSSGGTAMVPTQWNGLNVGMLVCADAYNEDIAATLRSQGAELLVSPAAWGPGPDAPRGEWEQRTIDTGLPIIVCNRTGKELSLDFSEAESLVIKNGRRLLWYRSPSSAVLTFDWSIRQMSPISSKFHITNY